jgi:hypothetical protein
MYCGTGRYDLAAYGGETAPVISYFHRAPKVHIPPWGRVTAPWQSQWPTIHELYVPDHRTDSSNVRTAGSVAL